MRLTNWIRAGAAALALMMGVLLPGQAFADDVVTLKDGRVLRGEIVREVDGYIWLKFKVGGIESTQMLAPNEVTKIERDAARPDAAPDEAVKPADKPEPKARGMNATPRAAVITLGEGGDKDMVGLYMTAEALRRAIPLLEADNVDIVVFRINSGGGALLEIQRLSDVIHNEYKPRFRTVAWIESAISAAAMTAHCLEEIYFTPEGNYGACTGWYGALTAVSGRGLEEVLDMMRKISARGGHDPKIMRSMQILEPLSATIDENGDVSWYQSTDGQFLVNPADKILTFNSQNALKFKFSRGTAKTLDDLTKAMQLQEVEWVGEVKKGYAWPICRAEQLQIDFRQRTFVDGERIGVYITNYVTAVEAAQSEQDPKERGKFINRARKALDQLKAMVKNNPNNALFVFGRLQKEWDEWVEQQEELLRRLAK